jgi:hypothetical protein
VTLWWIGNAIFLLVVIPFVVFLLIRLRAAVVEIGQVVDTIENQAGGISKSLDAVPNLLRTRDLVGQVGAGLTRYVACADKLL